MQLTDVRAALRSAAPLVAVEAPAGCGKTFEAVECAVELAGQLGDDQEILLLAHTNAAVGEFRRRIREAGVRARAVTLDAFARELVSGYTGPLRLPTPLVPGDGPGETPFRLLAPKALELLRRAPSIAAAVGRRHPVILLDEHQDSRVDQHELAVHLAQAAGSRLRIFGDPMQAIYGFAGENIMPWPALTATADVNSQLQQPQRWADNPKLGHWLLHARAELQTGGRLPLTGAPATVRLRRLANLSDTYPNSTKTAPALIIPVRNALAGLTGTVAILARHKAHVRGLVGIVRENFVIQEGADLDPAYQALAKAEAVIGDPQALAQIVLELLQATSTGLTANHREQLASSLLPDRLDRGRRSKIRALLECLEPLYTTPDLATWCQAIRRVLGAPPSWLRIDLPASLRLLGGLRVGEGESPRVALDRMAQSARDAATIPIRCVSTIHKAKGQEFDHVIIAHCSATPFPDNEDARRLLYVALSRARRSITILASDKAPSPLVVG